MCVELLLHVYSSEQSYERWSCFLEVYKLLTILIIVKDCTENYLVDSKKHWWIKCNMAGKDNSTMYKLHSCQHLKIGKSYRFRMKCDLQLTWHYASLNHVIYHYKKAHVFFCERFNCFYHLNRFFPHLIIIKSSCISLHFQYMITLHILHYIKIFIGLLYYLLS